MQDNNNITEVEKILIDTKAIEPHEYFKVLKSNRKKITIEALQNQLNLIAHHIISANKVGQTSLVERLAFTHEVLIKEQTLVANNFNGFVYEDDLKKFLDGVDNIMTIELSRYPRFIPEENINEIERAKKLNIFDEFCVVFTDFSGKDHKTEKEKEKVARNRDPVVFGYFRNKNKGIKHDRFYFITDWEDDDCDLTFCELIQKMEKSGIKHASHNIETTPNYLDELIKITLDDINKLPMDNFSFGTAYIKTEVKKSFWERVKFWKGN